MEDAAPPPRRADRLSWAVFLVLAAIYRWGRCPSFGGGDSPVIVYNALFGSGHDAVVLLARLASKLPFDTPEGHINALSGLFHAGAAALLFGILRRLGLKRVPALASVALLAFSRRYWYYGLNVGYASSIVFAFALTLWGVVAWKDEARAWPLTFSATGSILLASSLQSSDNLIIAPLALWCIAMVAALALQRLDRASALAPKVVLAGACMVPLLRPYSLRRHNPTLEWAEAAVQPIENTERVAISIRSLKYAAAYAVEKRGGDSRAILKSNAGFFGSPKREWTDILSVNTADPSDPPIPNGILLATHEKAPDEAEIARRAEAVLALPALSSIGLRDRAKYGFTEEVILYAEYAGILTCYRQLLPHHPELRARLDAQLAEYATD